MSKQQATNALVKAALEGDKDKITTILAGVAVDDRVSVINGGYEQSIEAGDAQDPRLQGKTPLAIAAVSKHYEAAKTLVDAGARITNLSGGDDMIRAYGTDTMRILLEIPTAQEQRENPLLQLGILGNPDTGFIESESAAAPASNGRS